MDVQANRQGGYRDWWYLFCWKAVVRCFRAIKVERTERWWRVLQSSAVFSRGWDTRQQKAVHGMNANSEPPRGRRRLHCRHLVQPLGNDP